MPRAVELTRTCALTREEKPVEALLRFAESPDGTIVPDVDGKAPGRGVWISLSQEAVTEAARKNVFARSLKAKVAVPSDLALLARTRLEQRLLGALGLARKAGALATGGAKVAALVEKGGAVALVTASDAAADGRRKMLQSVRRSGTDPLHIETLSSDQLGLALGLGNVIHAALAPGAAANSVMDKASRLAQYVATNKEKTAPYE